MSKQISKLPSAVGYIQLKWVGDKRFSFVTDPFNLTPFNLHVEKKGERAIVSNLGERQY